MAGRIPAREFFSGAQSPATASLWAEASRSACDAFNRTVITANPESKPPYEMWHGTPSPVVILPFLKPGYCKVKRENKLQAIAQECFYLNPAPDYPRDSVRALTRHLTVLFTRIITWQRVSPAPPVPAQTNDPLFTEEGGSIADDENTSDQGGGGLVDKLDDDLADLNDLNATLGFDFDAFLQERRQQAPAAGHAGNRKSETIGSSQGGAMDASSTPAGLKPGSCKVKRENKLHAKAQECFYLDPAPNYPRGSVPALTRHLTVLFTRNITWQRVSPVPSAPAQTKDPLSTEEGGFIADDEGSSDRGGGGPVNELDDGLAHLNDLNVTLGFDLGAFLQECRQQTPAAGHVGDGKAETIGSSRRGAMDASSAPVGRVEARRPVRLKRAR